MAKKYSDGHGNKNDFFLENVDRTTSRKFVAPRLSLRLISPKSLG